VKALKKEMILFKETDITGLNSELMDLKEDSD
jgi:hypothetical protein